MAKKSEKDKRPSKISKKQSLLKQLSSSDLKEICKHKGLTGFSGLKHGELAKFVAKNLDLTLNDIQRLVKKYQTDRLLKKIRDCADHFLCKRVEIKYSDETLVKAVVGGHSVIINNLGKKDFSYICDDACHDYQYQVKYGKAPFCKHYPAAAAELIYQGAVDPENVKISHIEGLVLDELLKLVEIRKRQEGEIIRGRDIEGNLKKLESDLIPISKQDSRLARQKYRDEPENVFEELVNQAFLLLEFDTITQRSPHGWDILVIGGRAVPPYLLVVECKTAANGIYDYLLKSPDYLVRLKSYALDMVKDKLIGAYRDYVRYFVVVAPGFPTEIEKYCVTFRNLTGLNLTFWAADVLLYFVKKYRDNPIVTHRWMESLFQQEKIISRADIDGVFEKAEIEIKELTLRVKEKLRQKFSQFSQTSADASFINLDLVIVESIIQDILPILAPELIVTGKKGVTGIDTINIKHDYFKIWEKVLKGVGEEFIDILREESFSQVKNPELKESILRLLGVQ